MIKNIIFDFDGVLADSEILVAKAFSKYLKTFNISFSEKEFSKYAGKKTFQVINELSEKFNILDKEKFLDDIMKIANNFFLSDLKPVFGAKNFLINNKKRIFIGSNNNKKKIITGLKKIQLDNFFNNNTIFSFDSVKKAKPYPDIFLKIIKTHKLDKIKTIIIEDSSVGIQAGVASGIRVIGFTAGKHWHKDRSKKELLNAGALCIIESYKDLIEKIKKL